MTIETLAKEIREYLATKTPDCPCHTVAEIADYVAVKAYIFAQQAVYEAQKQ